MTALQATVDTAPTNISDRRQTPATPAAPAVSARTWIAVIGATLGAFMALLNIQIVNASLADIQGAIGAGIDDGGWISTSYLIAEIVVIPLSGWLAQVFSVPIYLLTNSVLFLVLLAACALAQDLPQMIALRAVQGFTGGVLIPMAFYADHHAAAEGEATDRARAVRAVGLRHRSAVLAQRGPRHRSGLGDYAAVGGCTAGIEAENAGSASGLFNMMRNLGGAVGIAVLQTLLTKREQYHSNVLMQSVSPFEQATRNRLDQLTQYFMNHGVIDRTDALQRAYVAIGHVVQKPSATPSICSVPR
jgi:MFS family permease